MSCDEHEQCMCAFSVMHIHTMNVNLLAVPDIPVMTTSIGTSSSVAVSVSGTDRLPHSLIEMLARAKDTVASTIKSGRDH